MIELARAIYTPDPTPQEAADIGLTVEEASLEVDCWPEHEVVAGVFGRMGTQWNTSFSGATGLNYCALPVVLRLAGVPRADWRRLFEDIRTMERAALDFMRAK
ncbi:hypothetical protein CKY39_19605 [Variovorax boronicumulans]|uniref:DUF1799 domain-containing protein n=1 Tax=Variovorax boronicumulans TaxID=436515 RepID=A0A250DLG1_9BURK|nr:hypothetical protein CKY39_19605 [Variovorax boronicumulans]